MAGSLYGYWEFNGKNGLVGGPSSLVELPDGRRVIQKDPDLPAVLEDEFIMNALSHSRAARGSFKALYPSLDPVSQSRLSNLILSNPRGASLVRDDQDFFDMIQRRQVTSGVHV